MKTLKEMRQAVADMAAKGRKATADHKALRAAVEAAGDDATQEQLDQLKALDDQLDQLDADLELAESELQAAEKEHQRKKRFAEAGENLRPARSIFSSEPDPERTLGFTSLGEFATAVRSASLGAGMDERLAAPANFHRERGGSAGEGFSVPPQYREEIYSLVFAEPDLLTMVTREPTASNSVKILRDETTPWGSSGVQAYWRAEGGQMTASKLADKEVSVDLHQLYAFVQATEELLEDAPRLSSRLGIQAARAIRWKGSEAILTGTGSGQPEGLFGHASEVVVAKEAAQTADTIVAANVLKMYSRCLNPGNAVWLAHQSTLPQLATMTIGDQPVWTPPSTGLTGAPGGQLLGRPVMLSNHAKTVGDKGDIQLLDLSAYYAAEKGTGIQFAESMHLFFDYGVQAFRWAFRFGGRPMLSAPVTPANGAATLSPFVQLAERA